MRVAKASLKSSSDRQCQCWYRATSPAGNRIYRNLRDRLLVRLAEMNILKIISNDWLSLEVSRERGAGGPDLVFPSRKHPPLRLQRVTQSNGPPSAAMVARSVAQRSYDEPLDVDPSEVRHGVAVVKTNRAIVLARQTCAAPALHRRVSQRMALLMTRW